MGSYTLDSPIKMLPGVGATREKQLLRLGISTVRDLIYLFPRAYEDRSDIKQLSDVYEDSPSAFILTVATEVHSTMIRRGLTISKFRAFDESGSCTVTFFNAPFVKDIFHIGTVFRFYGRLEHSKRSLALTNPKFEPLIDGVPLPPLVPVYPLTEGISSKFLDKLTAIALGELLTEIKDPIPDDIRISNDLAVLSYALRNIHLPESKGALEKAIKRLAFDEMFMFGVGISLSARRKDIGNAPAFAPCDMKPLTALLPYELTASQKNTINDIYRDTVRKESGTRLPPMSRMVVGDVGSGKTICAFAAMYICAASGFQSALMAPTEILARQHFKDAEELFGALGIKTALLLGSTSQKEKKRIYAELADGSIQIVIGTHALISDKVEFLRLGLVITDEQHRFGILQRAALKDKSEDTHLLVMSATPIPRSLALTMYGDLDVSRITEMPRGRLRVDTFCVDESYRDRLNSFIEKQVMNGGQCYVVCPAIEKPDENDTVSIAGIRELVFTEQKNIKNATEHADFLRQKLPNLKIECLHGKMKTAEKDEIMRRFSSGEVDVLVSTTVIEVGVNVPNASLMIVEDADRFGLSQLHQLRGRVGRGSRKSYCVLVSCLNTEKARARLEIMRTTYDGYEIAERDLLMRGPGDFFASAENARQSGGFEFKLAKLCDDPELFERAFSAAKALVASDPELKREENLLIRKTVFENLHTSSSTVS